MIQVYLRVELNYCKDSMERENKIIWWILKDSKHSFYPVKDGYSPHHQCELVSDQAVCEVVDSKMLLDTPRDCLQFFDLFSDGTPQSRLLIVLSLSSEQSLKSWVFDAPHIADSDFICGAISVLKSTNVFSSRLNVVGVKASDTPVKQSADEVTGMDDEVFCKAWKVE